MKANPTVRLDFAPVLRPAAVRSKPTDIFRVLSVPLRRSVLLPFEVNVRLAFHLRKSSPSGWVDQ